MKRLFISIISILSCTLIAQPYFFQSNELVVYKDGESLDLAWAGGLNTPQVSTIDFNLDGHTDISIFDRDDNQFVMLRNIDIGGEKGFRYDFRAEPNMPALRFWSLLRDYNNDGKMDIFTSSNGGIYVYKNISTANSIEFEYVEKIQTNRNGLVTTLYVSRVDIPVIDDLDGDGDLDILTFGVNGTYVEYHENEGGATAYDFHLKHDCWGLFKENFSNNSVSLNSDCYAKPSAEEAEMHTGSTLGIYDLDNDDDMEVFLGDVSFKNLVMLKNGGSATDALMTSQDSTYPSNNIPVDVPVFPAVYFLDADLDNAVDMIVAPNTSNNSTKAESMWFYKNRGTTELPDFELEKKNLFQDQMIDVGQNATPVLFDYNGDDLLDLFVANGYKLVGGDFVSLISQYKNTGTATVPEFTLITDDYENMSTLGLGQKLFPTFGDLDADGDIDMIVGNASGKLFYFENIPAGGEANFALTTTEYMDIDVGSDAAPQLFDLDGDNLLDLIIGEDDGLLNYYKNTGTASVPDFVLENENVGNLDITDVFNRGSSAPHFFYDDGVLKLLLGTSATGLRLYDNISINALDTFNLITDAFAGIGEKRLTVATLADLNQDGYTDMIVGNIRGGLNYYHGLSPNNIGLEELENEDWIVYPNPTNGIIEIEGSFMPESIDLYNMQGQKVASFGQVNQIDIRKLSSGIYTMKLKGIMGHQIERVIKL
jgi:hypothetical protein